MKIRSIEKDAGILHESSHQLSVALLPRRPVFALGLELPLICCQSQGRFFDAASILFVNEVGAVAATALDELFGWPRQYSLAPVAEDAGPVTFEESDVKDPGLFSLVIFEAEPFVGVERNFCHGANLVCGVNTNAHP